jgi:LuxR family transcriptional regulator, maltose regulon positive regulatory protein
MDEATLFSDQLLATKFFVPSSSHPLIPRPHLTTLLNHGLRCKLTLISAPPGFGKTTLLSAWAQTFPKDNHEGPCVAWVSLDEGDNDPVLFWTYALAALDARQPGLCTPLLAYLQAQRVQTPPLRYFLQALINILASSARQFLLILDDYHVIARPEIHNSLTYLVEHLPPQLHIILATRADPPLPLSLMRARGEMLEVRTDQLRCTPEEVMAFFKEVMDIQLPGDVIQEMTARTEFSP